MELLRRLNDNWVMRVGGEAEGTDRREGGEARGLEGDDVHAVGRGLEVDQVERPGQGQWRRTLAVNLGRGHHVEIPGDGGLHHHGTRGHHLRRVGVHILGLVDIVGHVGDTMTLRDTDIPQIRGGCQQLLSWDINISSRDDTCIFVLVRLLDGDSFLLCARLPGHFASIRTSLTSIHT